MDEHFDLNHMDELIMVSRLSNVYECIISRPILHLARHRRGGGGLMGRGNATDNTIQIVI